MNFRKLIKYAFSIKILIESVGIALSFFILISILKIDINVGLYKAMGAFTLSIIVMTIFNAVAKVFGRDNETHAVSKDHSLIVEPKNHHMGSSSNHVLKSD